MFLAYPCFDAARARLGLHRENSGTFSCISLLVEANTEQTMARKYSKSAGQHVKRATHRKKKSKLKRGKVGSAKTRKQTIAIGLTKVRKKGKNVLKKS
jgi:hypothetical protein